MNREKTCDMFPIFIFQIQFNTHLQSNGLHSGGLGPGRGRRIRKIVPGILSLCLDTDIINNQIQGS